MANITVTFKDGSTRKFLHEGRGGGSYTKTVRYEGSFVIITDEWHNETSFPAADIKEIKSDANEHRY